MSQYAGICLGYIHIWEGWERPTDFLLKRRLTNILKYTLATCQLVNPTELEGTAIFQHIKLLQNSERMQTPCWDRRETCALCNPLLTLPVLLENPPILN